MALTNRVGTPRLRQATPERRRHVPEASVVAERQRLLGRPGDAVGADVASGSEPLSTASLRSEGGRGAVQFARETGGVGDSANRGSGAGATLPGGASATRFALRSRTETAKPRTERRRAVTGVTAIRRPRCFGGGAGGADGRPWDMFRSDDERELGAPTAMRVSRASPVLENVGVAAAFIACAVGFSLVLSKPLGQPLATAANEGGVEQVMLVSVHW